MVQTTKSTHKETHYERQTLWSQRYTMVFLALMFWSARNPAPTPVPPEQSVPPIVCIAPLPQVVPVQTAPAAVRVVVRLGEVVR